MSLQPINFSRPRAAPRIGWWLLAAGVATLIATQAVTQHWATERQQAAQAQQARAEALRVARQRAVQPVVPSDTEQRLRYARSELQRPWLATLSTVESAAVDPVYLLSLSFEPASGIVKIEAEAPSFEHALAFTQVLADGRVLRSANLASHEQVGEGTSPQPTVRFSVLGKWSAP